MANIYLVVSASIVLLIVFGITASVASYRLGRAYAPNRKLFVGVTTVITLFFCQLACMFWLRRLHLSGDLHSIVVPLIGSWIACAGISGFLVGRKVSTNSAAEATDTNMWGKMPMGIAWALLAASLLQGMLAFSPNFRGSIFMLIPLSSPLFHLVLLIIKAPKTA